MKSAKKMEYPLTIKKVEIFRVTKEKLMETTQY